MSGQTQESILAELGTLDTSHVSDALDKLAYKKTTPTTIHTWQR
jgi:hypothetical protein